ncbi:hypothetical protein PINS_up001003 [Pythium insidiosum]|nr:hypothetical protein PINS_up001003 [Pythium insidiosum]
MHQLESRMDEKIQLAIGISEKRIITMLENLQQLQLLSTDTDQARRPQAAAVK